jgi:hypothetical protein
MVKPYEIVIIVVMVLTIVVAHSVPVIANEFYIPWVEKQKELKNEDKQILIELNNKHNRKYYDIFDYSGLSLFVFDDSFTEIKNNKTINRLGEKYVLLKNEELRTKLRSILDNLIKKDYLIYFVKAENGHHITSGNLELLHNFDGKLKEAKSIWYLFANLNWKFKNKWIFKIKSKSKKPSDYFTPENNTIIEFSNNETFELSALESDDPKYFISVITFE